jgi:hypothetical protein
MSAFSENENAHVRDNFQEKRSQAVSAHQIASGLLSGSKDK